MGLPGLRGHHLSITHSLVAAECGAGLLDFAAHVFDAYAAFGISVVGLNRYAVFGSASIDRITLSWLHFSENSIAKAWEWLLCSTFHFARSSHDTPSATHDRRHAGA
jgi:hypothetical protein